VSFDLALRRTNQTRKWIMAKRKKASKVTNASKAAKRKLTAERGKARSVSRAAKATKRKVARAKPKRAPVKKPARKVKQPVTPVVETVAVEVIEQPAPGVINCHGSRGDTGQRAAARPEKDEPQPLEQPGFDAG
jgi:hypothetical protein